MSIEHEGIDRFADYPSLVKLIDNPITRNIIMIFTVLNRFIFNPARFDSQKLKPFFELIEKMNKEELVKEDYLFDISFVEDLVNFGLFSSIQSLEKFQFKGLQEKMPLIKGLKGVKDKKEVKIGMTSEAIEKILRFNIAKMEDLDVKKGLAIMRTIPCMLSNSQHDSFSLIDGCLFLSKEIMDLFQESYDCYLLFFFEKIKNDSVKKFNEMKLSILGLIKIFGKEFIQDSTIKQFSRYGISEFTDYIGSVYLKNDVLIIKTRFQNPVRLNDTKIPIREWIETLNKLIYCYLDIFSFTRIFELLIESTTKTRYTSTSSLKLNTLFENPDVFLSHMDNIYNNDREKITFSEETRMVNTTFHRTAANFYEDSLKLIKLSMNIINYLQNKHKFDEFLNNKEEFISLNKKVY